MATGHLTRELLWTATVGEEAGDALVTQVLGHLLDLCTTCEAEFQAWGEECRGRGPRPTTYAEVFQRTSAAVSQWTRRWREEERRAARVRGDLQALSPEARLAAVEGAPERFSGVALARELIEASRGKLPAFPRDSFAWAQLARTVLQHSASSPEAVELYARSLAYMGNARRAQGDLKAASALLEQARFLLDSHAAGDPLVFAELDRLMSSLRRHQRRLPEAAAYASRAIATYRREGKREELAKSLMALGLVYEKQQDFDANLAALREALRLLDPEVEPELYVAAQINVANSLCDHGDHEGGREVLSTILEPNRMCIPPGMEQYLSWLEGRISQEENDLEAARRSFQAVRHGFLKLEYPYQAAMVSLDLAKVYLHQSQPEKARALTEESLEFFESQEIGREIRKARNLLEEATRRVRPDAGVRPVMVGGTDRPEDLVARDL